MIKSTRERDWACPLSREGVYHHRKVQKGEKMSPDMRPVNPESANHFVSKNNAKKSERNVKTENNPVSEISSNEENDQLSISAAAKEISTQNETASQNKLENAEDAARLVSELRHELNKKDAILQGHNVNRENALSLLTA